MLSNILPPNEAHVYLASFSEPAMPSTMLLPLLNETERTQAVRYVTQALQERYILTRGLLRLLLGKYLQIAPESVTFTFNQHQKPMLASLHDSALQFNLSHSGDYVVFALTNGIEVGIDIEKIQDDPKLAVAERYFNLQETAQLLAAAPAQQASLFYRIWSKKEAVVKANGKGFAALHTAFNVSLTDEPETIYLEQQAWSLYTLNLHPGYGAALAASQPVNTLIKAWDNPLFHSP